jgi:hypothetical protein
VSLAELYRQYGDRVKFIKVYIREAHPVDGWWFGRGIFKTLLTLKGSKASRSLYDPKTIKERRAAAGECQETLKYGVRTYVDEMDDAVNKAYAAWPTRLYLIDKEGKVAYAGRLGPWGFKPSALGNAIQGLLDHE